MSKTEEYASFFTTERFSPGSLIIFALLLIMSALLFKLGFKYIAIFPIVAVALLLFVKSIEVIKIEKIRRVQIVGKKCFVVKSISDSEPGVVKVYNDSGRLDHETWSARTERGREIKEGTIAKVTAMNGIHLIVEQD